MRVRLVCENLHQGGPMQILLEGTMRQGDMPAPILPRQWRVSVQERVTVLSVQG